MEDSHIMNKARGCLSSTATKGADPKVYQATGEDGCHGHLWWFTSGAVASSRAFRASSCTADGNYGSVMLGIISISFKN